MKTLIEDYKRRLNTINAELEKGGNEKKIDRLITKASCYRTMLVEMNLALNIGDVSHCDDDTKDLIEHTKRVIDLIRDKSGIAVKALGNRINKKLEQLK